MFHGSIEATLCDFELSIKWIFNWIDWISGTVLSVIFRLQSFFPYNITASMNTEVFKEWKCFWFKINCRFSATAVITIWNKNPTKWSLNYWKKYMHLDYLFGDWYLSSAQKKNYLGIRCCILNCLTKHIITWQNDIPSKY